MGVRQVPIGQILVPGQKLEKHDHSFHPPHWLHSSLEAIWLWGQTPAAAAANTAQAHPAPGCLCRLDRQWFRKPLRQDPYKSQGWPCSSTWCCTCSGCLPGQYKAP